MNRPTNDRAAVIIAATHPARSLPDRIARFAAELGPDDEILIIDGSNHPDLHSSAKIRHIRSAADSLAPELWRDGLLATDAPLVALTTAQMAPRPGWLSSLKSAIHATGAAGVGGPIEPAADLGPTDRAVALLRYGRYFPPAAAAEPPGDNAIYRRDHLLDVANTWADGFWEVEVHQAMRQLGHDLTFEGSATLTFDGGINLRSMLRQRTRHALIYGHARARTLGTGARLKQLAQAPLVPPLLCLRAWRTLRAYELPPAPWLAASLPLACLATAWSVGEALGTLRAGTAPAPADSTSHPIALNPGKA